MNMSAHVTAMSVRMAAAGKLFPFFLCSALPNCAGKIELSFLLQIVICDDGGNGDIVG